MVASLLPLLDEDPDFPFVPTIELLLARWSGHERSVQPPDGKDLRRVFTLIGDDRRPARAALALVQAEVAQAVSLRKELATLHQRLDDIREISRRRGEELQRSTGQAADLRQEVDTLQGEVRRLTDELQGARADARLELAQSSTEASNEIGRLISRVSAVLDRELEELRLYLDRPKPNVVDALARIAELERLREEIRQAGGERQTW
jgi:chromosome segregation ATPase